MAALPPLFDFDLFINIARDLVRRSLHSSDEAQLRVAISSAYFGALGRAKQHLTQNHSHSLQGGPNTYTEVHDAFAAFPDADHQEIADILSLLRDYEMTANYEDVHPNAVSQAQTALFLDDELQRKLNIIGSG